MKKPRGLPVSPGIYHIVNDLNGKTYIGQTVSIRAHASHHRHLLTTNQHYNPPLQASYNKYGGENFTFYLLELCWKKDITPGDINLAAKYFNADPETCVNPLTCLLTRREQFHMDAVAPGMLFNTKPAGPSGTLGFHQPEEI